MNNTKTRFVIAISQKLSAAPDSGAKVDLIEELSENLYGRYQDMVASGMPEEEAYAAALDKLGDVNELLAYLDCCDKQPPTPDGPRSGTAEDWFGSLGGFVKQTVDQAVNAANDAAAMVRDAARSFDGGRRASPGGGPELEFPSQGLTGLEIRLTGDLTVYLDGDPNASVRLSGDTEDLQVEQNGNALTVTQDKSAGGSFFFSRGLSSPRVKLTIPQRHWDRLAFSTGSGDVKVHDGALEADHVCVKTTSGDMELNRLKASQSLVVQTASGDLSLTSCSCGQLLFHSASGDLEGENVTSPVVVVQTASGDVSLSGDIRDVKALTASGDLDLDCGTLPEVLQLATKSGDCSVSIPDSGGFVVRFSTVSGEMDSDFPLTTAAGEPLRRRAGEARYMDGGDGRVFSLSTVSGDIELQRN